MTWLSNGKRWCMAVVALWGLSLAAAADEVARAQYRVVDMDNPAKGMESKVVHVDVGNREKAIGATDESGYYDAPLPCQRGEQVIFAPVDDLYYPHKAKCPIKEPLIKVVRIQYIANLRHRLEDAKNRNTYGRAALLSNELAARLQTFDSKGAEAAELSAYESTAQELRLDSAAVRNDPVQRRPVMSQDLSNAIQTYQATNGLPSNGTLDYRTLRSLAGEDVGILIFQRPR